MQREVPEPWRSFLEELDDKLTEEVLLHCFGGFVMTVCHGLERPTADVDVLVVEPRQGRPLLLELGGEGSALHARHGVYLDVVTVAEHPDDYRRRLTEPFRGAFRRLRLLVLEPHDLALAKLARNVQRDRDDVAFLADTVPLHTQILRARYEKEMRPYLGNPDRADRTLRLWIEMIEERSA